MSTHRTTQSQPNSRVACSDDAHNGVFGERHARANCNVIKSYKYSDGKMTAVHKTNESYADSTPAPQSGRSSRLVRPRASNRACPEDLRAPEMLDKHALPKDSNDRGETRVREDGVGREAARKPVELDDLDEDTGAWELVGMEDLRRENAHNAAA